MAYSTTNFRTKKDFKDAVNRVNEGLSKTPVTLFQPGLGPDLTTFTGSVVVEGPHGEHKWYARAELVKGVVVSVK